jgi:hypothetical protein
MIVISFSAHANYRLWNADSYECEKDDEEVLQTSENLRRPIIESEELLHPWKNHNDRQNIHVNNLGRDPCHANNCRPTNGASTSATKLRGNMPIEIEYHELQHMHAMENEIDFRNRETIRSIRRRLPKT